MRIPLRIFFLWKPDPSKAIALSKKLLAFAEERLGKDTSAAAEQANSVARGRQVGGEAQPRAHNATGEGGLGSFFPRGS